MTLFSHLPGGSWKWLAHVLLLTRRRCVPDANSNLSLNVCQLIKWRHLDQTARVIWMKKLLKERNKKLSYILFNFLFEKKKQLPMVIVINWWPGRRRQRIGAAKRRRKKLCVACCGGQSIDHPCTSVFLFVTAGRKEEEEGEGRERVLVFKQPLRDHKERGNAEPGSFFFPSVALEQSSRQGRRFRLCCCVNYGRPK